MIPSPVLSGRLHRADVDEIDFTASVNIDGNVAADGGGQVVA